MNQRIYIKDWLTFKPYDKQTTTDSYYLKLCNDLKTTIKKNKQFFVLSKYLDNEEINMLSCFLTSYFEDLISETNIWNAFVRKHKELYGTELPFYNVDDYYVEEINPQDLGFLIWYFINTVQRERFVLANNNFIREIGEEVFNVFDKAWEYAPENEYLQEFYRIDENESDFYRARVLIDHILFSSYLFFPDTTAELILSELKIHEKYSDDKDFITYLNDNRDAKLHNARTRLLGLTGKEWAAEILGKDHKLSKEFLNISQKITGLFLYKGQDIYYIYLEHIASGKKFNLAKVSFDDYDSFTEIDSIIYIGIIRWKGDWWFSGSSFSLPYDESVIQSEKNSIESRMATDFLDAQTDEVQNVLNQQMNAFIKFNNGFQIAFMPSNKVEEYLKSYTEYFNNSLNLEDDEVSEENNQMHDIIENSKKSSGKKYASETGLVFFNPNRGVEAAFGVNSAFPMPNNPYFDIEESHKSVMTLLVSEDISKELAMYCIDNFKNELPFFIDDIGKKYLEDIDFFLRFWKKNIYTSSPYVSLI